MALALGGKMEPASYLKVLKTNFSWEEANKMRLVSMDSRTGNLKYKKNTISVGLLIDT